MGYVKVVNNLPLLRRTLTHWAKLEARLGESVTLNDGATLADAARLVTVAGDAEKAITDGRNKLSAAQATRNAALDGVYPVAKQARKSLKGLAKNSPAVNGLPDLPPRTGAPAALLAILEDIGGVWGEVDALDPKIVPAAKLPLKVPVKQGPETISVSCAEFLARKVAFASAAEAVPGIEDDVSVGIRTRNACHGRIGALVKDYGAVARGLLADGDPLLATIPTLSGK